MSDAFPLSFHMIDVYSVIYYSPLPIFCLYFFRYWRIIIPFSLFLFINTANMIKVPYRER